MWNLLVYNVVVDRPLPLTESLMLSVLEILVVVSTDICYDNTNDYVTV